MVFGQSLNSVLTKTSPDRTSAKPDLPTSTSWDESICWQINIVTLDQSCSLIISVQRQDSISNAVRLQLAPLIRPRRMTSATQTNLFQNHPRASWASQILLAARRSIAYQVAQQ